MTIVLFGGTSNERHVSVASAQNIVRALGDVLAWFEAPDGSVHDVAISDLLSHRRPFEIDFVPSRPAIFPTLEQALDTLPVDDPAVLLACHGGAGEDGTVQRMLEARGIPYTGSDSSVSAVAFDKARAKEAVASRVPLAESAVAHDALGLEAAVAGMLQRHERLVLKPLAGGSSRGLYFVDRGLHQENLAAAAAAGIPYVVEEFVHGRELTVGVIDHHDGVRALPVLEIEVLADRAFDYAGKYLGEGSREICPARIPAAMAAEAQAIALAAHQALGCFGYSRTDIVAAPDRLVFLETNTLPGLTTTSLVPQELSAAGIGFREFLERQLALARSR